MYTSGTKKKKSFKSTRKKEEKTVFVEYGHCVYIYMVMEIVSKHCIDEQKKIDRSIKPKMKMNDCK